MKTDGKDYRTGALPQEYPLATSLTPIQRSAEPHYDAEEALSRGTLFPGLDLPFMNVFNKKLPDTPLNELTALDFAADELALYLDTHKEDREAFDLLQTLLAMAEEAHRRYASLCGPLVRGDLLGMENYSWLANPLPWDADRDRRD